MPKYVFIGENTLATTAARPSASVVKVGNSIYGLFDALRIMAFSSYIHVRSL